MRCWNMRLWDGMSRNVGLQLHTPRHTLARVIDASWCIHMHKYCCLSASEPQSDWCKLMYTHAKVYKHIPLTCYTLRQWVIGHQQLFQSLSLSVFCIHFHLWETLKKVPIAYRLSPKKVLCLSVCLLFFFVCLSVWYAFSLVRDFEKAAYRLSPIA